MLFSRFHALIIAAALVVSAPFSAFAQKTPATKSHSTGAATVAEAEVFMKKVG